MHRVPAIAVVLGSFVLALGSALAQAPPPPKSPAQGADPIARAQAAADAGRVEEALAIVEPILKRDKKNARALLVRSTVRCYEGDVDACRKDLNAALAADPNLRQGWLNRSALAIAEKRYDDALDALSRAEELDPGALDNGLNQGAVLLLEGELEPATAQFRRYLERAQGSAEAYYLVATNYAFTGYAALAVEHLTRAVEIDERLRARARVDANFGEVSASPGFQRLISTDDFRPAPGSHAASKTLRTRYAGADSAVLTAALNAVQISALPLDSIVDVTGDWAIFWSRFRVKLAANADGTTTVSLSAPPDAFTPDQWTSRTDSFFTTLEHELLKLELAKGRAAPPQP